MNSRNPEHHRSRRDHPRRDYRRDQGGGQYRRDYRQQRRPYHPRRPPRHEHRGPREEPKPMPIGKKCNPLCPFFRCAKRALVVTTYIMQGKPQKIAYCNWIGDTCIGYQCQFAYCEKKALLPDGTCAFAVREEQEKKKTKDYLEELAEEDQDEVKARSILTRRLGRRDLEDLEF